MPGNPASDPGVSPVGVKPVPTSIPCGVNPVTKRPAEPGSWIPALRGDSTPPIALACWDASSDLVRMGGSARIIASGAPPGPAEGRPKFSPRMRVAPAAASLAKTF